ADENSPRHDGPSHVVGIDAADPIDGNNGDCESLLLEEPARSDNCRMLHCACDDVVTLVLQCPGHALEGQVVSLTAATGEDNFAVLGAEQRSDLAARFHYRGPCPRTCPMPTRRIAEMAFQEWPHRGTDSRIDRRAGVVVEVDAGHVRAPTSCLLRSWRQPDQVLRSERLHSL